MAVLPLMLALLSTQVFAILHGLCVPMMSCKHMQESGRHLLALELPCTGSLHSLHIMHLQVPPQLPPCLLLSASV